MSYTSYFHPCRSQYRVYMRKSIWAQSAASTPPAPECTWMRADRGSYSPLSRVRTSISEMAPPI